MPVHHERTVAAPSAAPTRKMEAVGAAGSAVVVLLFIASLVDFPLTIDVAHAVVALITAVIAFAAGYFRFERAGNAPHVSIPDGTTFPDPGPPPH